MIKLINKLTPEHDKLAHFYWGFIYALISYFLGLWICDTQWTIMVLPFILGCAKEIRDWMGYGTPEWKDFIYTSLPSAVMYLIFLI